VYRRIGRNFLRVPYDLTEIGMSAYPYLIGRLANVKGGRGQLPGKARLHVIEPDGVGAVFAKYFVYRNLGLREGGNQRKDGNEGKNSSHFYTIKSGVQISAGGL
jgi:hypothetical protein